MTVVERIVDWGFNVLHSDVDVVWFQDPLPYFLGPKIQDVDVAVSTGKCGACVMQVWRLAQKGLLARVWY